MTHDQEKARWQLKCLLPEIGQWNSPINEWEESFITQQCERLETDPDYQFSEKQLKVINRIYHERA